jgi:small subunit ribosomal protein S7
MPRKQRARTKYVKKQQSAVDRVYQSKLINQLIKFVMKNGKYNAACNIVYTAIDRMYDDYMKKTANDEEKQLEKDVMVKLLINRVIKAGPSVEVKTRRVGGANYQVPIPVDGQRKVNLVYGWLVEFARKRKGEAMKDKLAKELIDLISGRGSVVKAVENLHKMANANAAFANFRGKRA